MVLPFFLQLLFPVNLPLQKLIEFPEKIVISSVYQHQAESPFSGGGP